MALQNPWVGYLQRNYQEIKTNILQRLAESNPEVTDHSESNILVVVLGIFSGIAEMLNYYIDNMARESFITTCRKYSSAVKLTRLIDYRIKSKIPASVDILITFFESDGETPYELPTDILIPIGTKFSTTNGVEFVSVNDITVPANSVSANIPVRQKTKEDDDNLGVTTNDPDQVYSLGKDYVYNSIELYVGGEFWELQETLGRSKPTDKHYIVEVSASKEAYIRFGDNINGAIPTAGQTLLADYFTSLGSLGNVEIGTINSSTTNFTAVYGIPDYVITNPNKAVAGTDFEDIERIRRSAPLSLRTLDRAVTKQDYIDIGLLAPGVDKVNLLFNCGKYVNLYISPNGGGIASTSLLQDVEQFFDDKKMVTTFVKALPAGESRLKINLHVVGKFRVNGEQLRADVENALLDAYSYEKSDVNKTTRVSDLIALVDNLPRVDYLQLISLSIIPYIRPVKQSTVALNAEFTVNRGTPQPTDWLIKFDGIYMKILKNNTQMANILINQVYDAPDFIFTIKILPGAYQTGDEWRFRTMPTSSDLILNDYSVPVLFKENLTLTVQETLSK